MKTESTAVPSRRLIVVAQPKGSTGKSTFVALLADWLRLTGTHRVAVFDPDDNHRTITKIYGPAGSTPLCAPHLFASVDWTIAGAESCSTDQVLRCLGVDGPVVADVAILDGKANGIHPVMNWMADTLVHELAAEHGFGITIAIPVDGTAESALGARAVISAVAGRADILVIRNPKGAGSIPWDRMHVGEMRGVPRLTQITLNMFDPELVAFLEAEAMDGHHWSLFGMTQSRDPHAAALATQSWTAACAEFATASTLLLPGCADPLMESKSGF